MPNIIFDDDKAYFALEVTEEDIQREKNRILSDKAQFEQDLQDEDINMRELAQRKVTRQISRIEQLDAKSILLGGNQNNPRNPNKNKP